MKVYLATDHAGFELKNQLKEYLASLGHEVHDMGADTFDAHDDYPDFITPCAERVAAEADSHGIILGGSGQGEAMAANRVHGVRAAVFYGASVSIVKLAREHNNANILSLGARFLTFDEAKNAVHEFLTTKFSGDERHIRRLAKF